MWHKRLALEIASQLPDKLEDSLKILDEVRALTKWSHEQSLQDEATVLPFSNKEA